MSRTFAEYVFDALLFFERGILLGSFAETKSTMFLLLLGLLVVYPLPEAEIPYSIIFGGPQAWLLLSIYNMYCLLRALGLAYIPGYERLYSLCTALARRLASPS